MKLHDLKTDPDPFHDIWQNRKSFELRRNDRGFGQNDILLLREHTPNGFSDQEPGYTGRALVVHLIEGPRYGLEAGYVCMSIKVLARCNVGDKLDLDSGEWKKS
jgi:Domain of unknown function (DUF3850)